MVYSEFNPVTGNGYIVLKPNNSATWRFNMMVVASLALIGLLISTFFFVQGLWVIAPFSGLELLMLLTCLYLCTRSNIQTEVIKFSPDKVIVEQGRTFAEKSWEYHRTWAKIFVRKPKHRGHPDQIVIRSHGKELELGSFLNKDDKEALVKKLRHIIYR
ncbi:MAG: DUF2244 domain-containing protein [Gammaproteobacteria bacterium]|nr:DUF2244 domain-containing protein [Gammaproteobacteria bacterium]NNJ98196.1 DUF2244 domain-containing protein [Gammaproteobacteria bacterium]